MYSLLKSEVGPFPLPSFPPGIDLHAEDHKARRRLFPVTVLYGVGALAFVTLAYRSTHFARALGFLALGAVSWTFLEYLSHRWVLHAAFPRGKGPFRWVLHYLFDAAHADHHARPWDGNHINGHLDTLLAVALTFPLSLLAPSYTVSAWLVAVFVSYTAEEWVHHATHYWNFDSTYFQYIRRRHLYHHSRHGVGLAYGITSGIWDVVLGTRIPSGPRERLLPRPRLRSRAGAAAGA